MMFSLVHELAADGIAVAVACETLDVSTSGYYDWRDRPASARDEADAHLADKIRDIHAQSRSCYGAPRVHADLRLAGGERTGRKRVARLMRMLGVAGIGGSRKVKRHRRAEAVFDDLVQRQFTADAPDELWCTDITEHPTKTGKLYCCGVLDSFSRRLVGLSIADHMRTELVVDALQYALWRRDPDGETIVHSDRGSQFTSWVFGDRLRRAGLLGSMGRVASSVDNTMMESFWSTMQRELLDTQEWDSPEQLASAIFEWVEAWYNPRRRHSSIGYLAPIEFENLYYESLHATTQVA